MHVVISPWAWSTEHLSCCCWCVAGNFPRTCSTSKKLVGGGKGCQLPCCVHCRRDPRITSSSEMLEEVLVRAPRTTRCHAVGSARHSDLLFALPLALTHWICLVQD